jgi:hypothetical protein
MTSGTGGYWEHRGLALLWAAMLLPFAAWGLDELVGYALVKPVCAGGHQVLLTALSAAMLAMIVAGGWIAWSCLARTRRNGTADVDVRVARSRFMALVALGVNVLIGLLIVTAAVPPFVLPRCE